MSVAVEEILSDPENLNRTAEEVADLIIEQIESHVRAQLRDEVADEVATRVIDAIEGERPEKIPARVAEALDARRARTHRLLVVGQIQPQAPGETYTVALGPFSARGVLDSQEKFDKATQGGSAAREAGQGLAWDSKTGKSQGRFMLVPCFRTARDAWDFYRGQGPAEAVAGVAADWQPRQIEPVCTCGLPGAAVCRFCQAEVPRYCHRHDEGEPHRCRKAA